MPGAFNLVAFEGSLIERATNMCANVTYSVVFPINISDANVFPSNFNCFHLSSLNIFCFGNLDKIFTHCCHLSI